MNKQKLDPDLGKKLEQSIRRHEDFGNVWKEIRALWAEVEKLKKRPIVKLVKPK